MAKIGYIILAHQKPAQLVRLMKKLESDSTSFFLHIDKRVGIEEFQSCEGFRDIKNVYLLKRFKSYWGSIGLVDAAIEGIRSALVDGNDYIILVSGSDYPIKNNDFIQKFLEENSQRSFFTYYKMPAPYWIPNQEINRIKKYYFYFNNKLFEYPNHPSVKSLPRKILDLSLSLFLPKERIFPKNFIPYGGDQWFCITRAAGEEVINFYQNHPEVMKFLKYCLIPDEIFLQTALLNSKNEGLIGNFVNDTVTKINWTDRGVSPSPSLFTMTDYDQLRTSDKLFARKFDHEKYPALGERIDLELLSNHKV